MQCLRRLRLTPRHSEYHWVLINRFFPCIQQIIVSVLSEIPSTDTCVRIEHIYCQIFTQSAICSDSYTFVHSLPKTPFPLSLSVSPSTFISGVTAPARFLNFSCLIRTFSVLLSKYHYYNFLRQQLRQILFRQSYTELYDIFTAP